MSNRLFAILLIFCHIRSATLKPPEVQWTVANAAAPTVTALVSYSGVDGEWKMTSETSTNSSLSILRGAFGQLFCDAKYPVIWYRMRSNGGLTPVEGQIRTHNPFLDEADNYTVHIPQQDTTTYIKPTLGYIAWMAIERMDDDACGEYLCINAIISTEGMTTKIRVKIHEIPVAREYAQVIQTGFESIMIKVQADHVITLIYTTPPDAIVNHRIFFPIYNKTFNAAVAAADLEFQIEAISATISKSTFTFFKDGGDIYLYISGISESCEYALDSQLRTGTFVTEGFEIALIRNNYSPYVATTSPYLGYSELLVAGEFYEITMHSLGEDRIELAGLMSYEYDFVKEGLCRPTSTLLSNETMEVCGVMGFSYIYNEPLFSQFQDQFKERIGFSIFVQSKRPCMLAVYTENFSYMFVIQSNHLTASDYSHDDTSSDDLVGERRLETSINESITLSCLVPACKAEVVIGWCKLTVEKIYVACTWFPSPAYMGYPLWDYSAELSDDPSIDFEYGDIDPSTLNYTMTFSSLALNHSGYYACVYNKRWLGNIEVSPEGIFQLLVQEARPPSPSEMAPADVVRIALGCSIAILTMIGSLVITRWWLKRRAFRNALKQLATKLRSPPEFVEINQELFLNDQTDVLTYNREFEIDRSHFTIFKDIVLGSGAFGIVYKGRYENTDVAVKMVKDCADIGHYKALIDEATILSNIPVHINVLGLIAACTDDLERREDLCILTEFCSNGSLLSYLQKNRSKFISDFTTGSGQYLGQPGAVEILLNFAYQAALGMQHLAVSKIVHRDLALRNLLLTEGNVVKIGDYGLAGRYLTKCNFDPNQPLPALWMAVESFEPQRQFSLMSDVWSFGVVLWEMFSCGEHPYSKKATDFHLWIGHWLRASEQNRLGLPKIACDEMYQIMRSCWTADPQSRPSFHECKRIIGQILERKSPSSYQAMVSSLNSAWMRLGGKEAQNDAGAHPAISNELAISDCQPDVIAGSAISIDIIPIASQSSWRS